MNFTAKRSTDPKKLNKFSGTVLGAEYGATQQYLTKNGKPYIFRMGEFHFSRFPEDSWEKELIKMRNGGIDIVASYIFWIHHEETEGEFCFDRNRNIKKFLKICRKLGLPFVIRIGPWAHGEARNGGFPDWLMQKCNNAVRTDAQPYLSYVRRFFEQVYEQVKDELDVVVGIQLENELRGQKNYAIKLKEMLCDIGFFAPYFTFTGWGGTDSPESCPTDEVLLLYGGYPEAPWIDNVDKFYGSCNYLFSKERDDNNIGADLFEKNKCDIVLSKNANLFDTPFLTCELGGGNQVTYHRRPTITPEDIYSIAVCKLGSGVNGLGYYVYHGGENPVGKTTMQESHDTGYPTDVPIISYDFQAPLGQAGQIRKSYFLLRSLHKFIDSHGQSLATMPAVFPDIVPSDALDTSTLRCSVRCNGASGYLFVSNHYHGGKMKHISENVKIELCDGSKVEIPISISPNAAGIIPFNYKIGSAVVDWIAALPQGEDGDTVCFEKIRGIDPEICINGKILPLNDEMTVGGKKIVLIESVFPEKTLGEKIGFADITQSHDRSFFGHIVNYDGTTPEFAQVNEYGFTLPENTKYLKIEACGNIGALYFENKLISDFYLYGDKWIIDVSRLPSKARLVLKILPLTEADKAKIYMEYDMPTGVFAPDVRAIFDEQVYV